jgi:gluconolactonase
MKRLVVLAALAALAVSAPAQESKTIPDLGPVGPIVKLHGGFKFTEGPAADKLGNVFFTDIPEEKIYQLDPQGKLSVFREKSAHANGLMVNAKGEIVACEMDGRLVAISPDGKTVRPIIEMHEGKRFNAPNDLVIDKQAASTSPIRRSGRPLPCRRARPASITWAATARPPG